MAIVLYWNINVYIALLYRPVTEIKDATHVVVKGKPGNIDLCKLNDHSDKIAQYVEKVTQKRFEHLKGQPYIVSSSDPNSLVLRLSFPKVWMDF